MDPIDRISSLLSPSTSAKEAAPVVSGKPFGDRVRDTVLAADSDVRAAERAATDLAAGESDIVETMLAISRAELSLNEVVAFRNRFLEAYREIMSLQL